MKQRSPKTGPVGAAELDLVSGLLSASSLTYLVTQSLRDHSPSLIQFSHLQNKKTTTMNPLSPLDWSARTGLCIRLATNYSRSHITEELAKSCKGTIQKMKCDHKKLSAIINSYRSSTGTSGAQVWVQKIKTSIHFGTFFHGSGHARDHEEDHNR